jgi:hypothetical protein
MLLYQHGFSDQPSLRKHDQITICSLLYLTKLVTQVACIEFRKRLDFTAYKGCVFAFLSCLYVTAALSHQLLDSLPSHPVWTLRNGRGSEAIVFVVASLGVAEDNRILGSRLSEAERLCRGSLKSDLICEMALQFQRQSSNRLCNHTAPHS